MLFIAELDDAQNAPPLPPPHNAAPLPLSSPGLASCQRLSPPFLTPPCSPFRSTLGQAPRPSLSYPKGMPSLTEMSQRFVLSPSLVLLTNSPHSPSTSPPLLYHTPCHLQSLLAGYTSCNEPLISPAEADSRDSEIEGDFIALQSSGLRLGALLEARTAGDSAAAAQSGSPLVQLQLPGGDALQHDSDSDLSEPDPPALQIDCQRRVRRLGGNAGGLWT